MPPYIHIKPGRGGFAYKDAGFLGAKYGALALGDGKPPANFARPDDIILTADLPKTRSGKIMRRLLRDIAEGKTLGDTTTLADPNVIESLKEKYADEAE